ncbi:MAG TPA: NAD(P)/FAD-dependent oxidoreductase [Negativicutes bacterium]|nr:NAD(P)/FAD-dependent oxidoreductase [Negativicutes bacterium]
MKRVIVVGAGPAGLMAAISAAENGADVLLLEKMPSPGRKVLITGKGRCNFTNRCELSDFPKHFPNNGAFLYSALRAFDNQDLIDFFSTRGVASKVERGGRLFPVSDKASDIVEALTKAARQGGVKIQTGYTVQSILTEDNRVIGVACGTETLKADAVVLATGGLSYPGTGSTGDGYRMAKELGHSVTPLAPALIPLETIENWVKELQGLSLKNVEAIVRVDGRKVDSDFGEMMFTHFGISGPIILSLSQAVSKALKQTPVPEIFVDVNLKPALTPETLDKRLQRDFTAVVRKQFKNSLGDLLPAKMIPVIVRLSGIQPDKPVHQITREERLRLVDLLQNLRLGIRGTRPVAEAVVTAGGIEVKEIQPKTMESRLTKGLYFAGEIMDVDGYTGGFNLQAAFSTGFVAGRAAAKIDFKK